jgi:mRNA interferase RelE/StbE
MSYTVIIKKSAQKQIEKIAPIYLNKIKTAILNLAEEPRPHGAIKLTGSKNIYRIRIGDYRVVYEIIDKTLYVYVFDVDHRKQIYR